MGFSGWEGQVLSRFAQGRGMWADVDSCSVFPQQARNIYLPGAVYPYKIKIKCFWKYNVLNDQNIQESMNNQMFCFSRR